jgi:hypothetical protein
MRAHDLLQISGGQHDSSDACPDGGVSRDYLANRAGLSHPDVRKRLAAPESAASK